MNSYHLNC